MMYFLKFLSSVTIGVSDNDSVSGVYMSGNNSQNAAAKSAEQSFSENELDDIMAEFANLDAELSTQEPEAEAVAETQAVAEEKEEVNPLDELESMLDKADEVPEAAPVEAIAVEEEVHVDDFPAAEEFAETPMAEASAPITEEVVSEDNSDGQIISESDLEVEESDESKTPSLVEAFSEGFDEEEMDAIMKDLEEIDESAPSLEVEENVFDSAPAEDNVVALNGTQDNEQKETEAEVHHSATPTASAPAAGTGEVSFSAAGNMNFNVDLTIAGSQATLSVQDGCFKLTMNGVDISITEEGCKAYIEGGVNFNIPLPTDKKDVA